MPELLAQVPVQKPLLTVTEDRGYETQPVHATVMQRNATPLRTVMGPSLHVFVGQRLCIGSEIHP